MDRRTILLLPSPRSNAARRHRCFSIVCNEFQFYLYVVVDNTVRKVHRFKGKPTKHYWQNWIASLILKFQYVYLRYSRNYSFITRWFPVTWQNIQDWLRYKGITLFALILFHVEIAISFSSDILQPVRNRQWFSQIIMRSIPVDGRCVVALGKCACFPEYRGRMNVCPVYMQHYCISSI